MATLFLTGSVPGLCGAASGISHYSFPVLGNGLTGGNTTLCAAGTPTNFTYNGSINTWTWTCTGVNGGVDVSCGADENRCGDGYTGGQLPPQGTETCDFSGSNGPNGACSNICQWNTPSCVIDIDPTNGVANLLVNATGNASPWTYGARWTMWNR